MPKPSVTATGPLYDKRGVKFTNAGTEAIEAAVAEATGNEIENRLGNVLKNPTGFYESRVRTDRLRVGSEVSDSGVIYGPWLEGTSSRNQSTRFKGYATYRKATQTMQRRAPRIAAQALGPFVRKMNR